MTRNHDHALRDNGARGTTRRPLTEARKADRELMASIIFELCEQTGANCEREDIHDAIWLHVSLGDARVTIDFDRENRGELLNLHCMPWNIHYASGAKFTGAFGSAVGASVNPYHRRKCMGFARGIDALVDRLRAALECIKRGEAFEPEAQELEEEAA